MIFLKMMGEHSLDKDRCDQTFQQFLQLIESIGFLSGRYNVPQVAPCQNGKLRNSPVPPLTLLFWFFFYSFAFICVYFVFQTRSA